MCYDAIVDGVGTVPGITYITLGDAAAAGKINICVTAVTTETVLPAWPAPVGSASINIMSNAGIDWSGIDGGAGVGTMFVNVEELNISAVRNLAKPGPAFEFQFFLPKNYSTLNILDVPIGPGDPPFNLVINGVNIGTDGSPSNIGLINIHGIFLDISNMFIVVDTQITVNADNVKINNIFMQPAGSPQILQFISLLASGSIIRNSEIFMDVVFEQGTRAKILYTKFVRDVVVNDSSNVSNTIMGCDFEGLKLLNVFTQSLIISNNSFGNDLEISGEFTDSQISNNIFRVSGLKIYSTLSTVTIESNNFQNSMEFSYQGLDPMPTFETINISDNIIRVGGMSITNYPNIAETIISNNTMGTGQSMNLSATGPFSLGLNISNNIADSLSIISYEDNLFLNELEIRDNSYGQGPIGLYGNNLNGSSYSVVLNGNKCEKISMTGTTGVNLSGLTIINNKIYGDSSGSAISVGSNGSFELTNLVIDNNNTSGGINISAATGPFDLSGSISNNTCAGNGDFSIGGSTVNNYTMNNMKINNNMASNIPFSLNGLDTMLSKVTINDNTFSSVGITGTSSINIVNTTISDNVISGTMTVAGPAGTIRVTNITGNITNGDVEIRAQILSNIVISSNDFSSIDADLRLISNATGADGSGTIQCVVNNNKASTITFGAIVSTLVDSNIVSGNFSAAGITVDNANGAFSANTNTVTGNRANGFGGFTNFASSGFPNDIISRAIGEDPAGVNRI